VQLSGAWERSQQWRKLADETRKGLDRWRLVNLILIVLGAVFGTIASQLANGSVWSTVFAGTSAAVLAIAVGIRGGYLTRDRMQMWTTARAMEESLKSLYFQFRVGAKPFDADDAEAELGRLVGEVVVKAGDFDGRQNKFDVTPGPDDLEPMTIEEYVVERAIDQRKWHIKRGTEHQQLADRLRIAEIVVTILALILSGVAAVGHGRLGGLLPWASVATTVGAAIVAHSASAAYQRIATAYGAIVTELGLLIDGFAPAKASPEQCATFITSVESALARQNDSWAAIIVRP
jgi:hypothetical protein